MTGGAMTVREHQVQQARRRLIRFLLGSPLLAAGGSLLPGIAMARPERAIPDDIDEALDVFQIEAAARRRLDPEVWHFIVNGADDGLTVEANRAAFTQWQIRVRRLVDVSRVDTAVELFGQRLHTPVIVAPVGGQQVIHANGELATMQGASARGHLMITSTVSNYSVAEIRAAGSAPLWFQLYASPDRGLVQHLLAGAAAAGCGVVALTVDSPTRGNRQGERWFADAMRARGVQRLANFEGYRGPPRVGDPALTWDFVEWLRAQTAMKVVIKGVVTREDAAEAVRRGADGIIVSNHGGRQEESGRGTLECLPEVVDAVAGRIPVLIDGGFRRGTDIFKALALGAKAVCIGRPYTYGLGAWGDRGVAKVLGILDSELQRIMQFAGVTRVADIDSRYLQRKNS